MKEYVLVIELTTRAVHSRLISESGEITHSSTRSLESRFPYADRPYITELDPRKLWLSICGAVADSVRRAKGRKILAVTTTSQRFTTAIIDKEGKASALCSNTDARGAEMDDVITESMGKRAQEITGLHPPFLFSADRVRWFKQNEPEVLEAAEYVTTIDGWIYFKMTGRPVEEPSQAAGTFLFDIRRRKWSDELCGLSGVQTNQLPDIVNFGEPVGHPTHEFQSLTGIDPRAHVVMGAGDTHCSGIGSLGLSAGQAYVSLGSTAPLHLVMSEPRLDEQKRMWTGCFPLGGQWVLESNSGMCGTIFDWLALSVLQIAKGGSIDYDRFDEMAGSAPRGSRDVRAFLGPSIMNANAFTQVSPAAIIMPSLLVGRRPAAPEIARACYEDVAFACKGNLEQMKEVCHQVDKEFRAAGGMSNSRVLVQILADALAMPVAVPTGRSASAVGASIACWSFLRSERPDDVATELVKLETTVPSSDSDDYQSDYARWRLIYDKVRNLT